MSFIGFCFPLRVCCVLRAAMRVSTRGRNALRATGGATRTQQPEPRAQGSYVFTPCSPVVMPLVTPFAAGAAPTETVVASSAAAKTATPNASRLRRICPVLLVHFVCVEQHNTLPVWQGESRSLSFLSN